MYKVLAKAIWQTAQTREKTKTVCGILMTPEKKVKQKVVAILKKFGAYYFYPVMSGYGNSGVPDIVACYQGRFIGIECKAGKNVPTTLQQRNLDAIEKVKGIAIVVNESTIESIEKILNEIGESNVEIQNSN